MILFFLALLAAQDVEALVRQLGEDDPKVRDKASQALLEMGPAALQALKSHERDPDAELRERVATLTAEITRRERVSLLCPRPAKLHLSLKEVPVAEAVRAVLSPYGLEGHVYGAIDFLKTRKVTLELKDALFWEGFDALCKAAGITVEYYFPSFGVGFRDGQGGIQLIPHADVGDLRFTAHHVIRDGRYTLQVHVVAPPVYRPLAQKLEGMTFIDDQGRKIDLAQERYLDSDRRCPGSLTNDWLWEAFPAETRIEDWSRVKIQGTLVRKFPRNAERFGATLGEEGKPVRFNARGLTVNAHWRKDPPMGKPPRDRWTVLMDWTGAALGEMYLVWIEDAQGRWLVDGYQVECRDRDETAGKREIGDMLAGPTPPGKLVLIAVDGEEEFRTPFSIRGLNGPPKKKE